MRYVIVGNGAAGSEAAVQIRRNDAEGKISLVSKCPYPYYYKPRLIEYLAGTAEQDEFTIHKGDFYRDYNISFVADREIVSVDHENNSVTDEKGTEYIYDKLLLATGARCFIPDIPGSHKDGVFTIRGIRDCDAFIEYLGNCRHIAILGGGLLGLEIANSLNVRGKQVMSIIEVVDRLLPRQLDKEGAGLLRSILEKRGLQFFVPDSVAAIEGDQKVEYVLLSSGERIHADAVILSSGIRGRTELAKDTGTAINKGVVVDDYMRTSLENIWAAGDPVEHHGRLYGIWPAAREQGRIAGLNMAGVETAYEGTPFEHTLKVTGIDLYSAGDFNSDQGEIYTVKDKEVYKKAVIKDSMLKGVIILGDAEAGRKASEVFEGKADKKELLRFFKEK